MGKRLEQAFHGRGCPITSEKLFNILVTREMQVKTTISYQLILFRMAKIKKTKNVSCWEGYILELSHVADWDCKMVQPVWKTGPSTKARSDYPMT